MYSIAVLTCFFVCLSPLSLCLYICLSVSPCLSVCLTVSLPLFFNKFFYFIHNISFSSLPLYTIHFVYSLFFFFFFTASINSLLLFWLLTKKPSRKHCEKLSSFVFYLNQNCTVSIFICFICLTHCTLSMACIHRWFSKGLWRIGKHITWKNTKP